MANIPVSEIHGLTKANISRVPQIENGVESSAIAIVTKHIMNGKDVQLTLDKMLGAPWRPEFPAVVYSFTAKEAAAAVKERKSYLESLKLRATAGANSDFAVPEIVYTETVESEKAQHTFAWSDILESYKKLWCDEKGEVITPKYGMTSGTSRYYLTAFLYSFTSKHSDGAEEMYTTIPAVLAKYENAAARNLANIQANSFADAKRAQSKTEILYAIGVLHKDGLSETRIRKTSGYKVGEVQRCFRAIKCSKAYPDLNLFNRLLLGEFDIAKLNKEALAQLLGIKELRGEKVLRSETEMLSYFKDPENWNKVKGNKPSTNIAIVAKLERSSSRILNKLAIAFKVNDVESIDSLVVEFEELETISVNVESK